MLTINPSTGAFVPTHRFPSGVDLKSTGPARVQAGGQPQTGISFDRFVRACVVIKQIHESFVKLDVQRRGVVQMGYEDFMATVLQLP